MSEVLMGDISSIVRAGRSSCVQRCSAFIVLLVFRSESPTQVKMLTCRLVSRFRCRQGVSSADHRLSSGHPGRAGTHQRPQPTGGLQGAHPASARYNKKCRRRGGGCFVFQLVRFVFALVCFYSSECHVSMTPD